MSNNKERKIYKKSVLYVYDEIWFAATVVVWYVKDLFLWLKTIISLVINQRCIFKHVNGKS